MRKKVLFIIPNNLKKGQPSYERHLAFHEFYSSLGYDVLVKDVPTSFFELVKFILYVKSIGVNYLFISMPPFRNWLLFFLFKNKIVLDIRDGWSIAMKTGYGGTSKPNKLKSEIAKLIEKYAINNSYLTITCTEGLYKYLNNLCPKKELCLIPNGFSEFNKSVVSSLLKGNNLFKSKDLIKFVCVGKFSEYGKEKVVKLIQKISAFKPNEHIELRLIGANYDKNEWIKAYLNSYRNIDAVFVPRLEKQAMYKELLQANYGITIIRDPSYDYGTKVFDYILCDLPVFNYFSSENMFTKYFKGFLHDDYKPGNKSKFIRINTIIDSNISKFF